MGRGPPVFGVVRRAAVERGVRVAWPTEPCLCVQSGDSLQMVGQGFQDCGQPDGVGPLVVVVSEKLAVDVL